jgi:hypothetical protein
MMLVHKIEFCQVRRENRLRIEKVLLIRRCLMIIRSEVNWMGNSILNGLRLMVELGGRLIEGLMMLLI